MLINVAAVNESVGALGEIRGGLGEDGLDGFLAAAANQNRTARGLHDLVVVGGIVGGIGLDNVSAQLDRLPHERDDFFRIAVDHVAPRAGIGLKHQRLDHQRHTVVIALRF